MIELFIFDYILKATNPIRLSLVFYKIFDVYVN